MLKIGEIIKLITENMTTKTSTKTAIEAVKDTIARTLRMIDKHIATYSERMTSNYRSFFEWNAEDMFVEQTRRKFYARLAEEMEEWEGEDLSKFFLDMAQRKVNQIARGGLTRNSTNQMANLAHLLQLQAEQTLIEEIEGLAHLAAHAEW